MCGVLHLADGLQAHCSQKLEAEDATSVNKYLPSIAVVFNDLSCIGRDGFIKAELSRTKMVFDGDNFDEPTTVQGHYWVVNTVYASRQERERDVRCGQSV